MGCTSSNTAVIDSVSKVNGDTKPHANGSASHATPAPQPAPPAKLTATPASTNAADRHENTPLGDASSSGKSHADHGEKTNGTTANSRVIAVDDIHIETAAKNEKVQAKAAEACADSAAPKSESLHVHATDKKPEVDQGEPVKEDVQAVVASDAPAEQPKPAHHEHEDSHQQAQAPCEAIISVLSVVENEPAADQLASDAGAEEETQGDHDCAEQSHEDVTTPQAEVTNQLASDTGAEEETQGDHDCPKQSHEDVTTPQAEVTEVPVEHAAHVDTDVHEETLEKLEENHDATHVSAISGEEETATPASDPANTSAEQQDREVPSSTEFEVVDHDELSAGDDEKAATEELHETMPADESAADAPAAALEETDADNDEAEKTHDEHEHADAEHDEDAHKHQHDEHETAEQSTNQAEN